MFNFSKKYFSSQKSHAIQNPYVKGAEGKKLWDDRYMNMSMMIKKWQVAFLISSVTAILLALVIAKVATESRVQPFVVETNQGMPYAMVAMQSLSPRDQKLINFAVNQFIINTRTVLSDPKAEELLLNKAYAYSADEALQTLQDYFAQNNPFTRAQKYTISVNIVDAMPLSKNTWQITWDETQRFINSDQPPVTTRWMANLAYKFGEVNPKFMNDNPFGLYITQLSWSKNQMNV